MLVMVPGVLIALAVAALYQARVAWIVRERRALRRFLGSQHPSLLAWTPPDGFAVQWQCTDNVPPSARVRVRQ